MMGGSFDGERIFIDYENNHSGGQGTIIKADHGDISLFRFGDSYLTAGGNLLTFEPTDRGFPDAIHLEGGLVEPGVGHAHVLSMYPAFSWTAVLTGETIELRNGIRADDIS